MHLHRLTLGVSAALLVLGLGVSAASAAAAFASTSVNVRSGAGPGYAVVDVLRPGQQVEVDHCRGSWCFVEKSGPDGWVSAAYLASDAPSYGDDDYYEDDYDGRRYGYDDDYDYDRDYRYDDDYFIIERPRYRVRPLYPVYRSSVCWGGSNASFCISD